MSRPAYQATGNINRAQGGKAMEVTATIKCSQDTGKNAWETVKVVGEGPLRGLYIVARMV